MATTTPRKSNKSKKNRKHGRNKKYCEAYRNAHRREVNKIKRLRKHLKKFPEDANAKKALARIGSHLRVVS